jgi:hypothetical protein
VQEDAHQKKIAIQLRVKRRQPIGGVEHRDDVLQEAADVRMMIANTGRRLAEAADKSVVD